MSGPPKFQRCARCDQVITRAPVFMQIINRDDCPPDWYCRHCAKALS